MICMNCKKQFEPLTVVQRYCCPECGEEYRKTHKLEYPSITFNCSYCGKVVVTDGIRDKRTRFCCKNCEKKFWRHPPWEHKSNRTNFHSAEEYASWERRTNGE